MIRHWIWRTGADGILAAEADGLRLVVQAPAEGTGPARFEVLRWQYGTGSLLALLASGTAGEVREAMAAAERAAGRIIPRG